MPVQGLLSEQELANGGVRRIGKLHKGDKKVSTRTGKEYPVDLDHFRIVFEPEYEHLRDVWTAMYGEKPTEFHQVYLNASTAEEALDYWKEEWNTSGTLLRRCDGCTQHLWYNQKTGYWSEVERPCIADKTPSCECRLVGRMSFIFRDFTTRTGVMGYIAVETGSSEDIRELMKTLKFIEANYGTLRGVPLTLGRSKRKTTAPEIVDDKRTGKRISTTRSFLYIDLMPTFTLERLLPVIAGQLPPPGQAPHVTVEAARNALGNGGQRRIGGGQEAGLLAAGTKPADHWTNDRERVKKFLRWTQDKFEMDESAVMKAFDIARGESLEAISDWEGDEYSAIAAVVAAAAEYDPDTISAITSNTALFNEDKGYQIYELTTDIVERVLPYLDGDTESA
jgi:hypothetical protein